MACSSPQVEQQFSQGNIQTTGNSLDLAISGEGFFTVSNGGAICIRAPVHFRPIRRLRRESARPVAAGLRADGHGRLQHQRPRPACRFRPATAALRRRPGTLTVNLPANSTSHRRTALQPDRLSTATTNRPRLTVYDSLGAAHTASVYFVPTARRGRPSTWNAYEFIDGTGPNDAGTPTALEWRATSVTVVTPTGPAAVEFRRLHADDRCRGDEYDFQLQYPRSMATPSL